MNSATVVGIAVGLVATLFAIATVAWMIAMTRRKARTVPLPNTPVVERVQLLNSLLKLNHPDHPFVLRIADDADLRIEWDVVEARWIEALGSGSESLKYRAWLSLDDRTKTVEYFETLLQKGSTSGGPTANFGTHTSSGFILSGRRSGRRWAIGHDFKIGEVLNYRFSPDDVKDMIRQLANDAGWAFHLRLTKPKPTHVAVPNVAGAGVESVRWSA